MLKLKQEVMIVGDSLAAVGTVVTIVEVMPCETLTGMMFVYDVEPRQYRDGMRLLFQEKHLMPLGDEVVLEDMLAENIC